MPEPGSMIGWSRGATAETLDRNNWIGTPFATALNASCLPFRLMATKANAKPMEVSIL